jgi:hypothetical protein
MSLTRTTASTAYSAFESQLGIPKRRSGQRQPELKTSVNTTR